MSEGLSILCQQWNLNIVSRRTYTCLVCDFYLWVRTCQHHLLTNDFSLLKCLCTFEKLIDNKCMDVFLDSCVPLIYLCISMPISPFLENNSSINKPRDEVVWVLLCFSFLKLVWLFQVFCIAVWIIETVFQFLQNILL